MPRGLSGSYFVFVLSDRPDSLQPRRSGLRGRAGPTSRSRPSPWSSRSRRPRTFLARGLHRERRRRAGQPGHPRWETLNDSGETIASSWTDVAYLSRTGLDGGTLLGRLEQRPGTLAPGESLTSELTAICWAGGRTWRVILRTDALDRIARARAANTPPQGDTPSDRAAAGAGVGVPPASISRQARRVSSGSTCRPTRPRGVG